MDTWVIKHKTKRLFWSTEYKMFVPKSEECEAHFSHERKLEMTLPADGFWVKASEYGLKY